MKRRSAPFLATGLALAAALSLSACGSDDGTSDAKETPIAGADSAKPSPTASATADASVGVGRPKIELPSDLTYTFDWPKTGDGKKDAVMRDTEERIKAVDMAVARQKPLDKGYLFYSEGAASASSQEFIQTFVDSRSRITGKKKYFKPNVRLNEDNTAGFAYCEDQGDAFNKVLKTGAVQRTQRTKDSYVLYNTRLRLNDQGVWSVERMLSERGSATCRP